MKRTLSAIFLILFFAGMVTADLHAQAIGDALHGQYPALDSGENQ